MCGKLRTWSYLGTNDNNNKTTIYEWIQNEKCIDLTPAEKLTRELAT